MPFVVNGVEITIYKGPLAGTCVSVSVFFDQFAVAAVPGYSVDAKAIRKEKTKYCFYSRL